MLRASAPKSLRVVRRVALRTAAYDKRLLSLMRQLRASDREKIIASIAAVVAHRRSCRSVLRRSAALAG